MSLLEPEARALLRKVFNEVDKDGSRQISEEELKAALTDMGLDASKAGAMLREADEDSDGGIDFDEFEAAMATTFDSNLWKSYKVRMHSLIGIAGHARSNSCCTGAHSLLNRRRRVSHVACASTLTSLTRTAREI